MSANRIRAHEGLIEIFCGRTANPTYTAEELSYHLELTKARMVVADPPTISIALEGARASGISPADITSFDPVLGGACPDMQSLIALGSREHRQYREQRFSAGEGKRKLAFLSFSSGTTGKPKVIGGPSLSHLRLLLTHSSGCHGLALQYHRTYRTSSPLPPTERHQQFFAHESVRHK